MDLNLELNNSVKKLEQNIIGNILLDYEYIGDIDLTRVPFDPFYFIDKKCELIFRMMMSLQLSHHLHFFSVDVIREYAISINMLPDIGGEFYLIDLIKNCDCVDKKTLVQLFDLLHEKQLLLFDLFHEKQLLLKIGKLSDKIKDQYDNLKNTKWSDVLTACKFEGLAAALMENCVLVRIDILSSGILLVLSCNPIVESIASHFIKNRSQELSQKLSNYFGCRVDFMF